MKIKNIFDLSGARMTNKQIDLEKASQSSDADQSAPSSDIVSTSKNLSRLDPSRRIIPPAIKTIVERVREPVTELASGLPPIWISFLVFVVAPSIIIALYFGFVASDQFTVEARFAVRSLDPETETGQTTSGGNGGSGGGASAGGGSIAGFSMSATGQNAYIVTSYIKSRAAVDDTSHSINLRTIFRRPGADFWARLSADASIDRLVKYWNSMVDAYVDAPSGIVTLRVRAFTRNDAVDLAQALLLSSENLVNRISLRARHDAMSTAEAEVRKTLQSVERSLADLRKFRDDFGIIDPGQVTTEVEGLLLPLVGEKIKLENELFVATREMSESSPVVRVLRERLNGVEAQIKELRAKLTSDAKGETTVSAYLKKFEELEMNRLLNEKFYSLAQADFVRAQLRANRQSIYLTVFDPPALPEESRYPRRIAFTVIFAVSFLILWSIVVMIIASIEDHQI